MRVKGVKKFWEREWLIEQEHACSERRNGKMEGGCFNWRKYRMNNTEVEGGIPNSH